MTVTESTVKGPVVGKAPGTEPLGTDRAALKATAHTEHDVGRDDDQAAAVPALDSRPFLQRVAEDVADQIRSERGELLCNRAALYALQLSLRDDEEAQSYPVLAAELRLSPAEAVDLGVALADMVAAPYETRFAAGATSDAKPVRTSSDATADDSSSNAVASEEDD
ncbi:MAG: hypothetical protein ABIK89_23340 [Planctomycetota bacterium]